MKVLGLVPARGGSKQLPGKNLALLGGRPLLVWTLECARQASRLSRIVVSTDSPEIAEVAVRGGVEVPFSRPAEYADDTTGDLPVIRHALESLAQLGDSGYTFIAYLRPTTPFRTPADIDGSIELLEANSHLTGLKSVTRVSGVDHPYWMFKEDDGSISPFVHGVDLNQYPRRQLLPPCYRLNGVIDVLRVSSVLSGSPCPFGARLAFFEIPVERAVDIDDARDLRWAEFLLSESSCSTTSANSDPESPRSGVTRQD